VFNFTFISRVSSRNQLIKAQYMAQCWLQV
jgi:hypothetical protein